MKDVPDSITIRFPRKWCSAKNNTLVRKMGKHFSIGPNKKCKEDKKYVRDWLTCAAVEAGCQIPLWPDCDIKVELHYDVDEKDVLVTFSPIRRKPKSPTGRKFDLQSLSDILMDMAQGLIYTNDNQIAELHFTRHRESDRLD